MKSLAELQAIRDRMKEKVALREGVQPIRIVVGMATCGIAAGARPVLNTLVEEIDRQGLGDTATVTQTGCIGICRLEPIVEVYENGKEGKVTYVDRLGLDDCGKLVHELTEQAVSAVSDLDQDGFLTALAESLTERTK